MSTLFKHFPTKESLVFATDQANEQALVRAVTDRPPAVPALRALRDAMLATPDGGPAGPGPELVELIARTPALQVHVDQLWSRYADALAAALAADSGRSADDIEVRALARYVVLVPSIARTADDPATAIAAIFDRLESGWGTFT